MTGFTFHYGPRLVVGDGSASRVADFVGDGPVLFVTDRQIIQLGLAEPTLDGLRRAGHDAVLFADVEADPSRATLEGAVALGREQGVTSVVGFGGGSPMDVAKLAAYLLGSEDDLDTIWGVGKAAGTGLPLTLVPTTAGTGSEATAVAIITLPGGEKRGVSADALLAAHAVLDPSLTTGLPRSVTAATGIDAIVHAIEAYTSLHLKNPVSDMLARQALQLLAPNLRIVMQRPDDIPARTAMLLGAHLAGVAFANAPVAGVHALAYPLGGQFHVPHGLSNALMLSHVLRHNMPAAMPLYAELGPIIDPMLAGVGRQAQAAGLVEALERLSADCAMPRGLHAVGVGSEHLDGLADAAMLQERLLRNNPLPITRDDARRLYEAAL